MSGIQIGLGEITDINVSNFMRIAAVAGPGNAAYDRFLSSLIDKSDGALKGVTDPIEKILSAVFTHVQEKGLSGEFLNKYNRFTEAIDSGEKMSGASKSFYDALHRGQFIYNATDLPSPARVTPAAPPAAPTAPPPAAPTPPPAAVPPPVAQAPAASTSNLRGTLAAPTATTTKAADVSISGSAKLIDNPSTVSVYDVIYHSQSRKYPNIIKKWNDISNITPMTMDDGTEVFRFLRPSVSGAIDPTSGLTMGEYAFVSKDALGEYSEKNFGQELPEVIAKHRFTEGGRQLESPHSVLDSRYAPVRPNGINQNHGWKIHADFVADLTKDDAYARAGRAPDLSIIDQKTADIFDKRLANLAIDPKKFFDFYEKNHFQATGASFIDPNDIISASEVFQESGLTYKISPELYGSGRHLSAYPQSLEARDEITAKLENKLGNRLVDQNNASYRFNLPSERSTGIKNTPISRGVSARFTTDYLGQNASTGKFDLASQIDPQMLGDKGLIPADQMYIATGEINPEQIQRLNALTSESPEIARLLHGEDGYISPYKTIEQIAEERSSGKIPISDSPKAIGSNYQKIPIDVYNYQGPLPSIVRPGSTNTTLVTPPPAPTAPPPAAKTATDTTSTKSTLKVGGTTDVRTQPKARGTDGASGGKVTPSGTAHTVADTKDLTTKNTNPKTTTPKAQAKVVSQDVASTAERIKPATNRPSRVTTKGKDLVDNGLRTAQDLAGGNARLMGIAAAAGLLGLGVAATRKKNQPRAEADTTYLADSRRRMQY